MDIKLPVRVEYRQDCFAREWGTQLLGRPEKEFADAYIPGF
jgi:hypothetical protein